MSDPVIVRLEETGSTNKDAMRLAVQGERLPLWVVAERQTAGRGRLGRDWVSQSGNLFASVAVQTGAPLEAMGQLSLVAGIAAYDAVRANTPLEIVRSLRLKWPNDLLISGAKVGGILVESAVSPAGRGKYAVIGFGLNVVSFPGNLDRAAVSLSAAGIETSAADILSTLIEKWDRWTNVWNESRGFSVVREAWLDRAGKPGEAVTVNTGSKVLRGSYQGLDECGALLADVDGRRETINYGDVSLDGDKA